MACDSWTGTAGRISDDLPDDWDEAMLELEKRCSISLRQDIDATTSVVSPDEKP